jgi:hypothetical protein
MRSARDMEDTNVLNDNTNILDVNTIADKVKINLNMFGALGEPLEDPTSLVPVQRAIHLEFVLEDPLVGDDIGPRRPRNQVPHVVGQQTSYSSIAQRQWGSTSMLRTEVGTVDSVGGAATVESCRQSTGLVTPATRRVTIGWVLRGSLATEMRW